MKKLHGHLWWRLQHYGVDAPWVPALLGLSGLGLLGVGLATRDNGWLDAWGTVLLASALLYLHASLRGKFVVWSQLLDALPWRGDERVLDIGCGRGTVLLTAATYVPRGMAVGVDRWRAGDQLGNRPGALLANARALGVAACVVTADARALPFQDAAFDRVMSSLVFHNIPAASRQAALAEAARVLRPGGEILIVDIVPSRTRAYARWLREWGLENVHDQGLGWRTWFGTPWVAAGLVRGRKPAAGIATVD